ncbi:MAG: dihydrofolate reductase [Lachnospiraceae bacterium]|nr:dihydrofolate reductase [Lachnospiraceae bacterium]
MKLIATVDNHWAIGHRGGRLVRIPTDERFFRFETMYKTVIMSRLVQEEFSAGQPPRDRNNIILTRKKELKLNDVTVVHSFEEAMEAAAPYPADQIYVIGGASVFEQFLPYCDEAFITKIDYDYDADKYLPNLDKDPDWDLVDVSDEQTYYDLIYERRRYVRKKK